ncbi:ubiquitin-specific protease ubp2 [Microbotryomycetes sp. JL201]|nr:ubiquitin-specific protease ubp2 [Microbotryomycetes sp. JL201]
MADGVAAEQGARASSLNETTLGSTPPPPLPPKSDEASTELSLAPESKKSAPPKDDLYEKPVSAASFFNNASLSGDRRAKTAQITNDGASTSNYAPPPPTAPPSYEEIVGLPAQATASQTCTGKRAAVRAVQSREVDSIVESEPTSSQSDIDMTVESTSSVTRPYNPRLSHVYSSSKHSDDIPTYEHLDWQSPYVDDVDRWPQRGRDHKESWEPEDSLRHTLSSLEQQTPGAATPQHMISSGWTLPEPANISDAVSSRERGEDSFHGLYDVGWTALKIVDPAVSWHEKGGIWENTTLWDFDVGPTPRGDKYPDMGSFVARGSLDVKPNGGAASTETESASIRQPAETDLIDLDGDAEAQATDKLLRSEMQTRKGYSTITKDELDAVRPHPDMYFCRKTMSWVLFSRIKDSAIAPIRSQPTLWQRSRYDCVDVVSKLQIPLPQPFDLAKPDDVGQPELFSPRPTDLHERFLYVLFSTRGAVVTYSDVDFYPSVIPNALWTAFEKERREHPPLGASSQLSMYRAVNLIWTALDNVLFKGETRALPTEGKTFSKWVSWNPISREIFVSTLGFTFMDRDGTDQTQPTLHAPDVDERSEHGRINRARCLRCWLELGLWIEDCKTKFGSSTEFQTVKMSDTRITLSPSRTRLLATLEYENNLKSFEATEALVQRDGAESLTASLHYDFLGVPYTLEDDSIIAVYKQQCFYQSYFGPEFLTALDGIAQYRSSEALLTTVALEQSAGHKTSKELLDAFRTFGLAAIYNDNLLQLRQVDDETIVSAFHRQDESLEQPEQKQKLIDSLSALAEIKQSDYLRSMVQSLIQPQKPEMTLQRAQEVLGVGNVDEQEDSMLIMVSGLRVDDGVSADTIKEALEVIADHKNSDRIRHYLMTGQDSWEPWQAAPSVDPDVPVGLTNIANTCYLNSLLQYLFTVREVRDAVLQYQNPESAATQDLPRVGGRIVTAAEVERSRRFVELLQGLFRQLIHSPVNAVTPETELAYLALVPSKEENTGVTKQSNTTEKPADASKEPAAYDFAPQATSGATKEPISPSILGKRRANPFDEAHEEQDAIAVDEQIAPSEPALDHDILADVTDSETTSTTEQNADGRSIKRGRSIDSVATKQTEIVTNEAADGVREIRALEDMAVDVAPAPPPLPPRPTTADAASKERDLSAQVSNYMAFGRQNDVTECMDNVMFQLECAFNSATAQDASEVTAVLKRTFFGKTQQKLSFEDTNVTDPVRIRQEPFFSLLVDVAEEGRDMYDGLDAVFDDSVVEIEGKKARRRVSLVDVPDLLQIQLQRVQYDRVKQQIFKSNHYMAFGPELNLDRYLEGQDGDLELVQRRKRTDVLRLEIESLRAKLEKLVKPEHGGKLFRDILSFTSKAPELAAIRDEQLGEDLAITSQELDAEITATTERLQSLRLEIESIWSTDGTYTARASYELVAVFMHRGTATSGHYFIYQRDSKNPRRWLKYNDATVSQADALQTVFAPTTGDTNAYFLVYCRKDKTEAINSIARQL